MFTLIIQCPVKVEKKEKFEKLARKLMADTRKEKGCLSYDIGSVKGKENIYCWLERWENDEALEAHKHTPHFVQTEENMSDCFGGPASVVRIDAIAEEA